MNLALFRESVSGLIILLMVNKLAKVPDFIRISPECDQIHLRPHLQWEVLWSGAQKLSMKEQIIPSEIALRELGLLLLFNI